MKKDLQTAFTPRQYMLSRDFEIYYYNDRNMTSVHNHTHDYYEFYFFLGGKVSIEIAGKSQILSPGDVILIPPGTKHHLDILDPEESYQRFIFWITRDYYNDFRRQSEDYCYLPDHVVSEGKYIYHFDILGFNMIQTLIIRLIEEIHGNHFGKETKTEICLADLLLSLSRMVYEEENPQISPENRDLYRNILAYIGNHIDEDLSLDSLAREFYVSKYHIAHIFKEKLGISVHQYIIKKRLDLSLQAILGNDEITEVCLQCGFKDYSSFFRAFRKEYGISPKEYRKQKLQTVQKKPGQS